MVTITESAWNISLLVDFNVTDMLFAEFISIDTIGVLNLMRPRDVEGEAMYSTMGAYVESMKGVSPYLSTK